MQMMVHHRNLHGLSEGRNVMFVEPIVYQLQLSTTDESEMILLSMVHARIQADDDDLLRRVSDSKCAGGSR